MKKARKVGPTGRHMPPEREKAEKAFRKMLDEAEKEAAET